MDISHGRREISPDVAVARRTVYIIVRWETMPPIRFQKTWLASGVKQEGRWMALVWMNMHVGWIL